MGSITILERVSLRQCSKQIVAFDGDLRLLVYDADSARDATAAQLDAVLGLLEAERAPCVLLACGLRDEPRDDERAAAREGCLCPRGRP